MSCIDVFNGDADGLCALIQWRLAEPEASLCVTGVKREVDLLRQVSARPGDRVTVLDVSFDRNRADVLRLLQAGAAIRYVDHHYAGDTPSHPALELMIDTSPGVCTSLLVDRRLGGRHAAWAVAGAFGDNLPAAAGARAAALGLSAEDTARLRRLGELLNYNAYGTHLADLHFHPADLFARLRQYRDPRAVATESAEFAALAAGYESDLAAARAVAPEQVSPRAAAYLLPDAAWARRAAGVWANELSRSFPERAHLLVYADGEGTLTVSVRAAQCAPHGAAAFCRRYPEGGGREAAAGINHLAPQAAPALLRDFFMAFG
jgi:hypothetical protein